MQFVCQKGYYLHTFDRLSASGELRTRRPVVVLIRPGRQSGLVAHMPGLLPGYHARSGPHARKSNSYPPGLPSQSVRGGEPTRRPGRRSRPQLQTAMVAVRALPIDRSPLYGGGYRSSTAFCFMQRLWTWPVPNRRPMSCCTGHRLLNVGLFHLAVHLPSKPITPSDRLRSLRE